MNGLIIFCYCIVAYGTCNVIAFGSGPFKIFEYLRKYSAFVSEHFSSLFKCMMCLPTNFGIICSLVNWFFVDVPFTPFNIIFNGHSNLWFLAMLCDGAFTSGIVWLTHNLEEWVENQSKLEDVTDEIFNEDD